MIFESLPEFEKDLKRLSKRFLGLDKDLEVLKKVLGVTPLASVPTSFPISNLGVSIDIIKVKKFACRALKGRGANSGIRVIYAFHREVPRIVFLEMYFKGDKEKEDRERIRKYCNITEG